MTEKQQKNKCFVIYGPTASGKTALSVQIADHFGRENVVIINADSMQLFKGCPILAACPGGEDYKDIEHHLFQTLSPDKLNTVASWWRDVESLMRQAFKENKHVVVVGGTGLYLKSLIKGLPQTPKRDEIYMQQAVDLYEDLGSEQFFEMLVDIDPLVINSVIKPEDKQRCIRVYEVIKSTGKSLMEWQNVPALPLNLEDFNFHYHQVTPDRKWLYDRCNQRFDLMIEQGALEEIDDFIKEYQNDDYDYCRKVIGFDELKSYKTREVSLETAKSKATQRTRRYAKRQMTWARGQMSEQALVPFVKSWSQWDEKSIKDFAKSLIDV